MEITQKKQKNINFVLFVSLFLSGCLIGSIFMGVYYDKNPNEKIIEVEKEQPMILVEFIKWGENIEDSSEVIFNYFVNNFGNIEAKNVNIKCEVFDINDNLLREQIFNIGNIASNSYEYQESYMKYSSNVMEELGSCYLESVDGDYINLYDRLNDIE